MATDEDYGMFEPRINDFGDSYHLSDEEVYSDASQAVKNIRRKYRKYSDYVEAMLVIEEYLKELEEKYGGKKEFQLALQLQMVKEFIPPIPKYRKTDLNVLQCQAKCVVSDQDEEKMSFVFDDAFEEEVENASQTSGDGFEMVQNPVGYFPFDLKKTAAKEANDEQTIANELDLLQKYSESEEYRAAQSGKKKKKSSRNLLKEAKRRKKILDKLNQPKTIGQIVDHYNDVCNGVVTEDEENFTVYRGIIIPIDDFNTMKVTEEMRACGLMGRNSKVDIDSKELRKMIKSDAKAERRKKKNKKKHEMSEEDMDEFLENYNESDDFGSNYQNFKAFEKEMLLFDKGAMMRGIDS